MFSTAQETEQPVEEIEEISADFKFDLQEKPDEGRTICHFVSPVNY